MKGRLINVKTDVPIKNTIVPIILYMHLLKQIYSFLNAGYDRLYDGAYAYQQLPANNFITLAITMLVLISTLALSFGSMHRNNTGTIIMLSAFSLIVGTVIWTFITVRDVGFVDLIYTSIPPYVYLTALALYIGMDRDVFASFIKHAPIIGCISIILGLVYNVQFLLQHAGSVLGNSAAMVYFVQGILLMSIYSFCAEKPSRLVVYAAIGLCGLSAMLLNSRSWMLQSAIWLVAFVWFTGGKAGFVRFLKIVALLAVTVAVVYIVVQIFFPHIIETLLKKMEMDTRSQQYIDLFAQTEWYQFIFGAGYDFTYDSVLNGDNYRFIDNAYLLMLIRYGVIVAVPYTMIFLVPVLVSRFSKESVPLVMWLAALGGLSVFCVTTIDIKSIVISICAGRCLSLALERRGAKKKELAAEDVGIA